MRKIKLKVSLLVVLSLGIVLMGSGVTEAASWRVSPISLKGEGKSSYCSMKRSFSNGKVLVFARDVSESNSIAFDLKEALLETGKRYSLKLMIQPGIKREIIAAAVSPQVLIMQMGHDLSFYDALKRKDELKIELDKGQYKFPLAGTSSALNELDACVVALSEPKYKRASQHDTTNMEASSGRNMIAYHDKKEERSIAMDDSLLAELASLKEENRSLQLAKESAEAMNRANQIRHAREKGVMEAKAELKIKNLKESILELRTELNDKRAKLDFMGMQTIEKEALEKDLMQAQSILADREKELRLKEDTFSKAQQANYNRTLELEQELANLEYRSSVESEKGCQVTMPLAIDAPHNTDRLKKLIYAAHVVNNKDGLQSTFEAPEGSNYQSYSWESGHLYGGANQLPWEEGKTFQEMIGDYLYMAEERCSVGDFATSQSNGGLVNGVQYMEVEIACVTDDTSVGAALLFYGTGDVFTVISHEGTTDQMHMALSKRNAVSSVLQGKQ